MSGQPSIDIHAHFFPERYLRLIAEEGGPFGANCDFDAAGGPQIELKGAKFAPMPERFHDMGARLASMDEQGVDLHALSLTTPMVYWASPELGLRLSQAFNDGCAEYHEAYPDRFVGLAMLPMQAPALAVEEIERASKLPGIRGVYMATQIDGADLSDPRFFPVFERIEALGWTIFLHPTKVVDPDRLKKYYLTNLIGNPTESAIAAAHLIFGEVLDKFPKLTVCLPHGGGSVPYLVGRLTHGWSVREETQHLKTPPDQYLRRFYYDTITHAHPALDYLISLVGVDRVVLGSDFCFDMSYRQPVAFVNDHPGLTDASRALILGGNAARLLDL